MVNLWFLFQMELPGLDVVANRLLDDHLFLTALELHMELLESGQELGRLRDFFSNPANFERMSIARNPATFGESSPPQLARAASVQTFDSIDFARYSDDGERVENDRVAILEFELRNAQDTIRLLRMALTKTAATELTPQAESCTPTLTTINEPAQPYERRALNFLVYEYLLNQDYKLTSVTFSEENANQDFDDWDDVGINVAKPPDLLRMYREFGHYRSASGAALCDAGICTDNELVMLMPAVEDLRQTLECRTVQLNEQIRLLESENARLLQQLEQDGSHHPLGSTPLVSPVKPMKRREACQDISSAAVEDLSESPSVDDKESMLDSSRNTGVPVDLSEQPSEENYETAVEEVSKADEILSSVADDQNDLPAVESAFSSPSTVRPDNSSILEAVHSPNCKTSVAFQQLLLNTVFYVVPENRIFGEVSRIAELNKDAIGEMVPLLARCLPHIVPSVLLAAREELIPLIVSAASLHADSKTRDNLLNLLFNLIKRPEVEQRQMILLGCVAFARHAGASRVESELLPQCWEQIAHRHVERRLLVAEACGALTPHIPSELRGSLLLSMLQQMLEDSVEDVREAATRSLGVVVGFVEDDDKYHSTETLLFSALNDSSERVLDAVKHIFLPSLAMWAMNLGRLESSLLSSFIDRIEKVVDPSKTGNGSSTSGIILTDSRLFVLLIGTLCDLLPVIFSSFVVSGPFAATSTDADVSDKCQSSARTLPKPSAELLAPALLLGSEERLHDLLLCYEEYVSAEWYHPWPSHNWVADELVSRLVLICESLDSSEQTIVHILAVFFRTLCHTFGPSFAQKVVRTRFCNRLQFPAANVLEMSHLERLSLVRCSAPVYAAGVLAAFSTDDDRSVLSKFLTDFVLAAALHRCSLAGVMAAVTELCLVNVASASVPELLLSVLWDCVVHTSVVVRVAVARIFEPMVRSGGVPESLIGSRVVPALVTLAGDSNSDVRSATVGAFGATIECVSDRAILDKVYMQLQSLMDDSAYRDEHALHVALIRAIGRAGPSSEPRFRDDFILPRLTALAVQNSTGSGEATARRTDIALALFDAYNSVSCCFIGNQHVSEVLLPGLRCLHRDLVNLAPDHAPVVASMIREFEDRIDSGSGTPGRPASSVNGNMTPVVTPSPSSEGIRLKMMGHIKDVKDRASHSNLNLTKMFNATKK